MALETISTKTLRELIEAGGIRSALLVGTSGGVSLKVRYGMAEKSLKLDRGGVRVWRTIDAAAKFCRSLGIANIELDLANWLPDQRVG